MSKKSKIEPKRKTVTSAPPPVPRIRGGYIPPKDIPPNYEHWNRFPIMSVREAIFLTIGIEPRASQYPEERKNKARFLEIDDIVQSHVSYGSLKLFRRGIGQVSVSAWMDWLQMVGMSAPPEWRPVGWMPGSYSKPLDKGGAQWEEAVSAAIAMRDSTDLHTPRTQSQLYEYILENRQDFPNCCPESVRNVEAIKARVYRERKGEMLKNPLKDPRFLSSG